MHQSDDEPSSSVQKVNYQPTKGNKTNPNRYALQFFKETNEEIKERKELARHSLQSVTEEELEVNGDDFFLKELDFPKRPPWSHVLSKQELEASENKYFSVSYSDFLKLVY